MFAVGASMRAGRHYAEFTLLKPGIIETTGDVGSWVGVVAANFEPEIRRGIAGIHAGPPTGVHYAQFCHAALSTYSKFGAINCRSHVIHERNSTPSGHYDSSNHSVCAWLWRHGRFTARSGPGAVHTSHSFLLFATRSINLLVCVRLLSPFVSLPNETKFSTSSTLTPACCFGLHADAQGSLAVYLHGQRHGLLVAGGLAGPLCWCADIGYGSSIRIDGPLVPPS